MRTQYSTDQDIGIDNNSLKFHPTGVLQAWHQSGRLRKPRLTYCPLWREDGPKLHHEDFRSVVPTSSHRLHGLFLSPVREYTERHPIIDRTDS